MSSRAWAIVMAAGADVRDPRKPGFLPDATWLIACSEGYVGTVQGVMDQGAIGAIQNVGVLRTYRGLGLGRALVRRALAGFSSGGICSRPISR